MKWALTAGARARATERRVNCIVRWLEECFVSHEICSVKVGGELAGYLFLWRD